ncbi:hypothetical protein L484_025980 [Morus notabilis]|uniref:Ethylene-responsive nuclear family protein n=1 Tax=Morus notabilis TaxID=981085 RepID=W9RI76_9ROSA|nr:uncharacterized protein LOC21408655 [Morus notabilis]EXB75200.1 hypothetical protein L484_025980 [Morus notabilis]
MPLPWKKTKVTRISRIVADLQSPKRGGSLVVETGFPTSLIDLFVKNRDRLKKPSIKKKKKKKKTNQNDTNQPQNDIDDFVTSDPITANSHSSLDDSPICVEPISEEAENLTPSESVEEEEEETEVESVTHEDQNRVVLFLAVLKIFAVVVLGLSTKKLTVGITLSAFVLLFLEYVGKRLICRFLKLFWFKKEEDEFVHVKESKSLIDEIEVGEANNNNNDDENREEIFSAGPDLELLSRDKKWGFVDTKEVMEDGKGDVLVVEKSKSCSKRAKIRAKIIKNFVPKKLRSSKRDKKPKYSQDEDNKVEKFEEEKEEDQQSEEEERFEKIDDGNELSVVGEEQVEEESKGNWVCLTLFLIVLVGLFGGRILAFLLTIAWCFVFKLIRSLRRSSLAISS